MKSIVLHSRLIIFCTFFTMTMGSCKKEFLEITPKGKLIAKTVDDYKALSVNLTFLNMAGFGAWGVSPGQAAMGDEVAAFDPYFIGADFHAQRLFRWEDEVYLADENSLEMEVPLSNIYIYNKIINEVMDASGGTEQDKKTIRAQAMTGRAWTYFLLINYFGKPYTESGAATDPGFPIITEADVTETSFTRASVKEVYDFIINDLTTALPDLPTTITHRMVASRVAGEAILGKVYMFMGKFNEALPLLNAAITGLGASSIPAGLYNYNETLGTGGSFLPITTYGPTYPLVPANKENIYAKQFTNFWTFTNNELVITAQTAALFKSSDLRLNFYSDLPMYGSDPYPGGLLRRMGPIGTQFGVIVPDLYLLNAECKARVNDLTGARQMVETFRENRMPPADASVPAAIASSKTALVKFILEERIREFAMQGFRWFDMRRLSVDPDYSATVGKTHILYDETGGVKSSYTLKPERLVWQFPRKMITQNPDIENNP
jgi:hypothetical protein